MHRLGYTLVVLVMAGCGHRYTVVGESDTKKVIAISIMKIGKGEPTQLYYTELTANDTEFIYDSTVNDEGARVEAWFDLKGRPGQRTVYALPPDRRVRLKLDEKNDSVVIEEIKINGGHHSHDD